MEQNAIRQQSHTNRHTDYRCKEKTEDDEIIRRVNKNKELRYEAAAAVAEATPVGAG